MKKNGKYQHSFILHSKLLYVGFKIKRRRFFLNCTKLKHCNMLYICNIELYYLQSNRFKYSLPCFY